MYECGSTRVKVRGPPGHWSAPSTVRRGLRCSSIVYDNLAGPQLPEIFLSLLPSPFESPGIIATQSLTSVWVLEIWTRILTHAQQTLLSTEASPQSLKKVNINIQSDYGELWPACWGQRTMFRSLFSPTMESRSSGWCMLLTYWATSKAQ